MRAGRLGMIQEAMAEGTVVTCRSNVKRTKDDRSHRARNTKLKLQLDVATVVTEQRYISLLHRIMSDT